jgi:hypothetical protein
MLVPKTPLADEATLDVVRLLGVGWRHFGPGNPRTATTVRSASISGVLGEIASCAESEYLRLEPLSAEATAELARGHEIDAAELHRRTSGNPFFVQEVLRGHGDIPETARAAVLSRLAGLGPEAAEVVDTVALAPPETPVWLLERVCSCELAYLAALRRACS